MVENRFSCKMIDELFHISLKSPFNKNCGTLSMFRNILYDINVNMSRTLILSWLGGILNFVFSNYIWNTFLNIFVCK